MNKRVLGLWLPIAVAFVCASCQFDDSNLYPEQIGNGASISVDELQNISPTGGSFTFTFTSTADWVLNDCPHWLSFSKTSGKSGSTTIVVRATLNNTRKDRNAVVKFSSSEYDVPMTVSQECPYLRINNKSFGFDWDSSKDYHASSLPLVIESNVDWKFVSTNVSSGTPTLEHFGISQDYGKGSSRIEILPVVMNTDKEDYQMTARLAAITYNEYGRAQEIPESAVDSYDISMSQKHIKFLINETINPINNTVSELGDSSFTFHVDTEVPWKVQYQSSEGDNWTDGLPSWISANRLEAGSGASDLILKWQGTDSKGNNVGGVNPYSTNRLVHLRIISTDATMTSSRKLVYRDIKFNQSPYVLRLGKSSEKSEISLENDEVTDKQISVTSSGAWQIKNIPSWMDVTPVSGVGNQIVTVKAKEQNLSTTDLTSSDFRLESLRNDIKCDITATQARFKFDLDSPSVLGAIPTRSTLRYSVTFESSGGWEISGAPDWLDISQTSAESKGLSNLQIGAKTVNPDENQDRSATLVFSSLVHKAHGKTLTRMLSVLQRKYSFDLTPSALSSIPAYSDKYNCGLLVVCSGDWAITSCPNWLTPSVKSGDGLSDVNVTFTPSYNTGKTARSGKLEVKDNYKGTVKSYTVNQDGFVFDSSEENISGIEVINKRSYTVSFDLTEGAPWEIVSGYGSWVSPDIVSGKGRASIRFTPTPNPNTSKRTTSVKIHSIINDAYKEVYFQQNEYEFDTRTESFSFTELSSDRKSIVVTSSGDWTVKNAPSWMKVSSKSGPGNRTIYLSVDNNVNTTERSGSFTIVSELNSSLYKTVNVKQDPYVFNTDSESFSYTAINPKEDHISVRSSGNWLIKDVPYWISMSSMSGTGQEGGKTTDVTLTPSDNLSESSRSAVFYVVSADNSSLTKRISVQQSAFVFYVSTSSISFAASKTSAVDVRVDCTGEWTAKSNNSWISVQKKDDKTLSISVSNNTSSERKGTVTVTSTLNNKSLTINIVQSKK